MHVHILGICGTFMGGIAALAKASGHQVTGSDNSIYPPMSDQLAALGIEVVALDDPSQFEPRPDIVVVGNVMSRGAPAIEFVLNERLRFTSGPQWLSENILMSRNVIAVAGTHGKTTTASLVAWLLESTGMAPGFLIGGVPRNFGETARLGDGKWFVVEADEYDTAFFDKRSKFVHYQPRVAVLNNLEFDHADIFDNLAAIKTQFHHLVRLVPANGTLIVNDDDANIADMLKRGCWSPVVRFNTSTQWHASCAHGQLEVNHADARVAQVPWSMPGQHNASNVAAASAACIAAGASLDGVKAGLASFAGVRRRADVIQPSGRVTVIDDFAHHPTAVDLTLAGLREDTAEGRLIAVVELRSNTMKMGLQARALDAALAQADRAFVCAPPDLDVAFGHAELHTDVEKLLQRVMETAVDHDTVAVMSNGGFANFSRRLAELLEGRTVGG